MSTEYYPVLLHNINNFELVENYFKALLKSGKAQQRFPMYYPVTLDDIFKYINDYYNMVIMVLDVKKEVICGEITLNMFQGKAAFAHFSIHPNYLNTNYVKGCKEVLDILCESKELQTLIAWIPETNKIAHNFVQKIGFKYQCKVDNTCYVGIENKYVSSFQSIYNRS